MRKVECQEAIANTLRVAFLVLLVGALSGADRTVHGDAKPGSPVGKRLADFSLTSIEGKEVRLSQFQGKRPVLLVFGSST